MTSPAPHHEAGLAAVPADPAASDAELAPLNLSLPQARGGQRASPPTAAQEALADARAHTPRNGFGERMARALGADQARVEEPLSGESVRVRNGSDCVVISRSRESQLDPFNQSVNPSARGVTSCR